MDKRKVTIQYSLEMDDVPKEIAKILTDTWHQADDAHNDMDSSISILSTTDVDNIPGISMQLKQALIKYGKCLQRIDEMIVLLDNFHRIRTTPQDSLQQIIQETIKE